MTTPTQGACGPLVASVVCTAHAERQTNKHPEEANGDLLYRCSCSDSDCGYSTGWAESQLVADAMWNRTRASMDDYLFMPRIPLEDAIRALHDEMAEHGLATSPALRMIEQLAVKGETQAATPVTPEQILLARKVGAAEVMNLLISAGPERLEECSESVPNADAGDYSNVFDTAKLSALLKVDGVIASRVEHAQALYLSEAAKLSHTEYSLEQALSQVGEHVALLASLLDNAAFTADEIHKEGDSFFSFEEWADHAARLRQGAYSNDRLALKAQVCKTGGDEGMTHIEVQTVRDCLSLIGTGSFGFRKRVVEKLNDALPESDQRNA